MADQTPSDPTTELLGSFKIILTSIVKSQKALQADQEVLSINQKFLVEKFSDEIEPLYDQLIQITERLDQIERTMYDDAWARRTELN